MTVKKRETHPKGDLVILGVAVAILSSLFLPRTAVGQGTSAPIVSVDPVTQYDFNEHHANGMVGWVFNLQQAVTVNQVGWYDDGKDGLSRSFRIGLWQDLTGSRDLLLVNCQFITSNPNSIIGNPVNGITIPAGTSAPLNGAYRVVNLPTPLTLPPGNYELGGLDTASTTDPIRYLQGQYQSPAPGLTQGPFFWADMSPSTTLKTTQNLYLANGLEMGPMLFIAGPEPNTLGLLVVGALFLARRGRRGPA